MHGIDTIRELNNLAAENAPGRPQQRLQEAEAVHKERSGPSKFDTDYAETLARNKAQREKAVANLMARPDQELIDLARSNNSLPSTLETALANKLELALQRLEEFSN